MQAVPDNLESMLQRIRVVLDGHRNFESVIQSRIYHYFWLNLNEVQALFGYLGLHLDKIGDTDRSEAG